MNSTVLKYLMNMQMFRDHTKSTSFVPAERWQTALAADCAAPGHVSAFGGEAASLCSPALTPAPARPEGKLRTLAAPPRPPRPGQQQLTTQ